MKKKIIAVVDGMGGGLGAQLVERLVKLALTDCEIIALTTNALAARRLVDSGAHRGASGENAICVSLTKADFILGPIGIIMPNSMMGEITTKMAEAVCSSSAHVFLVPVKHEDTHIAGVRNIPLSDLLDEAVALFLSDYKSLDQIN